MISTLARITVFVLVTCSFAKAQSDSSQLKDPSLLFSIVPQYAIVNGFKFDVEKRIDKGPGWVVFSPEIYAGNINRRGEATTPLAATLPDSVDGPDRMTGYGAEVVYKYFLKSKSRYARPYIAFSLSFRRLTIGYYEMGWQEVEMDGLKVWENLPISSTGKITRIGPSFLIGTRDTEGIVLLDIYAGVGLRQVWIDDSLERFRDYNRHATDYAFFGVTPMAGLKMSVVIK